MAVSRAFRSCLDATRNEIVRRDATLASRRQVVWLSRETKLRYNICRCLVEAAGASHVSTCLQVLTLPYHLLARKQLTDLFAQGDVCR